MADTRHTPHPGDALATGKVYDASGTKYIYLRRDAVETLGLDAGDHVAVRVTPDGSGLTVTPADGDPAVVECVHCGTPRPMAEIARHHLDAHPGKRYDPAWYTATEAATPGETAADGGAES